jgi:uncharacterized membrane protein YfcA
VNRVTHYPELQAQADEELARRGMLGVWGYAILVALLIFKTDYVHDHPRIAIGSAACVLFATAIRLYLIVRKNHIYRANPKVWRML